MSLDNSGVQLDRVERIDRSDVSHVLVAINVKGALSSIQYRAYQERLADQSVLDWIVQRLFESIPKGACLVCVCETNRERERLLRSYTRSAPLDVVASHDGGGRDRYKALMQLYSAHTLVVCGFSHALAPEWFVRGLVSLHRSAGSRLTILRGEMFTDPLSIVDVSAIESPVEGAALDSQHRTRATASGDRQIQAAGRSHLKTTTCLCVEAANYLQTTTEELPERIAIRSSRDVEILREALRTVHDMNDSGGTTLMQAWKGAVVMRRRRLLDRRPGTVRKRCVGKRPVRVLYASNSSGFTGAQQSLCHLIGAIDRERYQPTALISYSGAFHDQLKVRDVPVICPERSIGDSDIENVILSRDILARCSPDLIHANHSIGMPLTAAAIAAGIPLIQHVRVATPIDLRPQLHAATAIIAVSDFVRRRVAELDIDAGRIEVIWNGVDVQRYIDTGSANRRRARQELNIGDTDFIVTMIARFVPSKRHDTALHAVCRLRDRTNRGHLILVGEECNRKYVSQIKATITNLGISSHVTIIDFVSDIRPILHASDVIVLPSEDEPLGRAALEGMVVGRPVVVSDSGGTKEIIQNEQTGYIVACGDSSELASRLTELAVDPSKAARLGAAAALWSRTALAAERCAERTMEVYDRAVGRRMN